MEILLLVLVLLVLIGTSNVIQRLVPFLPVPIIQIALGIGVAYLPSLHHAPLNPELFFVLFIAPLLFNDGQITPREDLWRLRTPIILMALGLVFATVLIAGPFIHWMIPAIPLSAAFALAAILSPTDAVAVGSISSRAKLPGGIQRLLEGEALMNDASGLVAFNFAIAATVTGYFSLTTAVGSFIVIALGGLVLGAVLGFAAVWLRVWLRRLGMEDVTVHVLILILTPFLVFLAAEHLHVSGILAVVAAGIMHAVERDRVGPANIRLNVVANSTWSVILYCLNGLVFMLLGLEIPGVISTIWKDPSYNNGQVIGYIFATTVLLLLLRFVWVWVSERKWKLSLLTALSGVRGAVTLAGAFSIPLLLGDGSPFPERNLILFICAGVILLTLVVASVALPLLTREPGAGASGNAEAAAAEAERRARISVLEAGLHTVREEMREDNEAAALELKSDYAKRLQQLRRGLLIESEFRAAIVPLRLEALEVERKLAQEWLAEGRISPGLEAGIQTSLNQIELALTNRTKLIFSLVYGFFLRLFKLPGRFRKARRKAHPIMMAYVEFKQASIAAAKKRLREVETEYSHDLVMALLSHYEELELRLRNAGLPQNVTVSVTDRRELEQKAVQAERNEIQRLFEAGEIDRKLAGKLRVAVNFREASHFELEQMGTHASH
ncbi:sodium/proton antiporter, CPA1 family [Paenibacillaceae bacterium GAS479]|nr:sodium/proton antiporter, CPA1 family [Paenibacillaceae bacterium GAS479]